jgi:hypothetical protein
LIGEEATQGWRREEHHSQDDEHENERDPEGWQAVRIALLKDSASREHRGDGGPTGQSDAADERDP